MNKVYFHLPGIFEHYQIYRFFIPIFLKEKEKFYDYVEIGSIYGSSPLLIWNCDCQDTSETFLPQKEVKDFYDTNNISIAIVASNLLLEKTDLYNATANYFINTYNEQKNEIIIGSELLKELIDNLYTKYKKISSTHKCLSKEDTKKELNNGYDRVILNTNINSDFDFLYNLSNEEKKKIEIIVNPTCLDFCGHRKEHYEALSHDILYRDNTAKKFNCEWQTKNFIEKLNSNFIIKNEDLIEKYINNGFINFNISNAYNSSLDILYFLAYYLIKPEYYLEITYRIISSINDLKKTNNPILEVIHEQS